MPVNPPAAVPARPGATRSNLQSLTQSRRAQPVRSMALLIAASLGLGACSGGGISDSSGGDPGPTGGLRLVTCSIGCADSAACAGGEIGLNEPMIFEFNQLLDPDSVSPRTLDIVSVAGVNPDGEILVDGRRVTFQPRVRYAAGVTSYGYVANTDYLVTMSTTGLESLRSQSGAKLAVPFQCTVRVGDEPVDVDGEPPRIAEIDPSPNSPIDPRPTIFIEFSELLDFAPFFDPTVVSPVEFRVGTSGALPDGTFTCADTELVPGYPVLSNDETRAVTILRFIPQEPIPEDRCLSIVLTERVRDLAGTPARRLTVPPMFVGRPGVERTTVVRFDDPSLLDAPRSNGEIAGGELSFGVLGGDGRHGDFRPADGQLIAANRYRWSTDSQLLTAKDTMFPTSGAVTVTGGQFFFSDFVLPTGVTVEFVGANPVQIFVRGQCRIEGSLILNGETVPDGFNGMITGVPRPATPPGQQGGLGGPGGGAGGDGGARANGQGPLPIFNGSDGEDLTVPGSSFWASSALLNGTGGKGSLQYPDHGLDAQLAWYNAFGTNYDLETGKGGGGGGFTAAGAAGSIIAVASVGLMTNNLTDVRAASGSGGSAFTQVVNQARPAGVTGADYYLVGGSGGGGGGSHPALARQLPTDPNPYRAGASGGGGGGALLIRSSSLQVGPFASIQSRGGNGPASGNINTLFTNGAPLPGGGGSGGTILLQTERTFSQGGTINVSGGNGGQCVIQGFYAMDVRSGAGAPGYVRIEKVGSAPTAGGAVVPNPAALGVVPSSDFDQVSGVLTRYVPMFLDSQPRFRRYEIDALVDGVPMLFSDDPEVPNSMPALAGQSPLQFFVQSIETDPVSGNPLPGAQPGPWRRYVGSFGATTGEGSLVDDGGNGFRFMMFIDRAFAQNVVVQELRVSFRT
jgi:hypothetical protein